MSSVADPQTLSGEHSPQSVSIARARMVESQLRPNRVSDKRILAAMGSLSREVFLPASLQHLSYSDATLPVRGGRFLLSPLLTARLLQAAEIEKGETVLVIAGGSAYLAAIAERLKTTVFLLDRKENFSPDLDSAILDLRLDGCVCLYGDPRQGWKQDAPYRSIVIDGGVEQVPEAIFQQLERGGTLTAVRMQEDETGEILRWRKDEQGRLACESLFDASAPVLSEFAQDKTFVL